MRECEADIGVMAQLEPGPEYTVAPTLAACAFHPAEYLWTKHAAFPSYVHLHASVNFTPEVCVTSMCWLCMMLVLTHLLQIYFYTEHHEPSTAMAPAFAELAAK